MRKILSLAFCVRVLGFLTLPTSAQVPVIVEILGDSGLDIDSGAAPGFDQRTVEPLHNQPNQLSEPTTFPYVVTAHPSFSTQDGGGHLNFITPNFTQVNNWSATTDSIDLQYNFATRAFTQKGASNIEFMQSFDNEDLKWMLYIQFDHAWRDVSLHEATLSEAESNFGTLHQWAQIGVGKRFPTFTAEGDTAFIFASDGEPVTFHWNFWKTQNALDPDNYDQALAFDYAVSMASVFNRYPDVPLDVIYIDYLPENPNVWNPDTSAFNGNIDYDEDGVADYSAYSWINEEMKQGFLQWQLAFLQNLREDYPNSRIIANGGLFGRPQSDLQNNATYQAMRSIIDGASSERLGATATYSQGFTNPIVVPLERVPHLAELRDTHGLGMNLVHAGRETITGSWSNETVARREAKGAVVQSLLAGGGVFFFGGDWYAPQARSWALEEADKIDAGQIEGTLQEEDLGSTVRLRRDFSKGKAVGVYTESTGWPTTGDSLYFEPWTLTAAIDTTASGDGSVFTFTAQPTGNVEVSSYQWTLSQPVGTTLTGREVTFDFPSGLGVVDVDLLIEAQIGSTTLASSASASVIVPTTDGPNPSNVAPVALFGESTSDSLTFAFADSSSDSDGSIVQWNWNFGDGSTSNEQNPSHTYSYHGGNRLVQLVVTDDDGATAEYEREVYVRPGWVVADFTAAALKADSTTWNFDASPTASSGQITGYYWLMTGTGAQEVERFTESFDFTFPAVDADYDILLSVTADGGSGIDGETISDSETKTITTSPPDAANVAPSAAFSYSTDDSLTHDFADFSTDSDGSIVQWNWTFGDGASSQVQNPSKTYAYCDCERTVQLKVWDNDGAVDSTSQAVTIPAQPPAPAGDPSIASAPSTIADGQSITITGSNFGTKVPAEPKLWDNFDSYTDGQNIEVSDSPFGARSDNPDPHRPQFSNENLLDGKGLNAKITGIKSPTSSGTP